MGFRDDFSEKVQSGLEDRQQAEAQLVESIQADAEQVDQLEDKIEAALESGNADAQVAIDSLNRDHLVDRIAQNQKALDDLRHTPLYSLKEYEEECRKIRSEYMGRCNEIKARLIEKLEEALLVMDEADALRKEGNGCVRELRQVCADAGEDVNRVFKGSAYNSGTIGQYILIHENEYRKTLQNIISGLRR